MKKLKKGEIICDKCDGSGCIPKKQWTMVDYKHISYDWSYKCDKCKGEGKLDWVENVVGKKPLPEEVERERLRKIFKSGKFKIIQG
jgi:DnaJ-class molecular chaperone